MRISGTRFITRGSGPVPGWNDHWMDRGELAHHLMFMRWHRRCSRNVRAWRSHQLYWRLHP